MPIEDSSSLGTCSSEESDENIGYHPVGAEASSSKQIWDSLTDMCKRSIGSKYNVCKDNILMDLDACSFVISTDEMDTNKKSAIREFLLLFGSPTFGRCSFPSMITGSKQKDSLFGCAGNESQHLPHLLRGNEMLVLDAPVKIGLHTSSQPTLINALRAKGFYFSASSKNTGLCFEQYAAANKPPYSVIIDAIIDSCEVPSNATGSKKSTCIIHIADMGFRSPLDGNHDAISKLFTKCRKMATFGLLVELTQLDIAFVFQMPQDHLLQATLTKNDVHGEDSLFQKSRTTIYPIHKLPPLKDESLKNSDLKGTFEVKKENWEEGRIISFDNETDLGGISLFSSTDRNKKLRESIAVHSSTLHSIKGYSTIAHSLLQKRTKFPMDVKAMYGIGQQKFQYIQTLIANLTMSLNETFDIVKSHGIAFRIEVSLRPHFNDPLRYSGHGNDLLLIASLALQELCGPKFKSRLTTFPTSAVKTHAMKLLSEVTSMVRHRKDIRFDQVYSEVRVVEWLRSHLSILLITIGLCPRYGVKYVNQWLKDGRRFDPHNKITHSPRQPDNNSLALIRHRMLKSYENCLKELRFSERAIYHLRKYLEDAPNILPSSCFSSLSLGSKHLLVQHLWTDVIPRLSKFLSSGNNQPKSKLGEIAEKEMDTSKVEYNDILETLEHSTTKIDRLLEELMEKAVVPTHPLAAAVTALVRLSMLWNPSRFGYNQILLSYVMGCHAKKSLGLSEITDPKTLQLIRNCLRGLKLTRDDLRHVCINLIPRCGRGNQPIICFHRMLCKHYQFPNPDVMYSVSGSAAERRDKNVLINLAFAADLSVLVSQDSRSAHFHRISENTNVEVVDQSRLLRVNTDVECHTRFQHHNLYCLMTHILNSKSDSCLRSILFERVTETTKRLQDIFLSNKGTTNPFFSKTDTLKELELKHEFFLMKHQNDIVKLALSNRYEPEIVLSIVSYVYQKNIVFYNTPKCSTSLFLFWKSRSIMYTAGGCNCIPLVNSIVIRLDSDKQYKWQDVKASVPVHTPINHEASELFSMSPIGGRLSSEIRLNTLCNRRRTSSGHHFQSALSKLLIELDNRYEETSNRDTSNQDPFGLKPFLIELSRSSLTQKQCFDFSVRSQCKELDLPLRIMAAHLDSATMTHNMLCPLICLKHHHLLIGVFDYTNKTKATYFYAMNPFSNTVEMKKFPKFVCLIDRNQTLYLYTSQNRSEYFVPEEKVTNTSESRWKWDVSLNGKYSHLSNSGFERCLDQLKSTYNIPMFHTDDELEGFQWRPDNSSCTLYTSVLTDQSMEITFLPQYGVPHVSLIVIFPTLSEIEKWDICIVHHPGQDHNTAMQHLTTFVERSPEPAKYNKTCIKGKMIEICESAFYMLFYAFLASQSKLLPNFVTLMNKAIHEPDLKMKCQQWIQTTMRTKSRVNMPWILQMTWINHTSNSSQIPEASPTNSSDSSNDETVGRLTSKGIGRRRNETIPPERNRKKNLECLIYIIITGKQLITIIPHLHLKV